MRKFSDFTMWSVTAFKLNDLDSKTSCKIVRIYHLHYSTSCYVVCRERSIDTCLINDVGTIGFTLKKAYMCSEGDPERAEIIETMENIKLNFEAPFKGNLSVNSLFVDLKRIFLKYDFQVENTKCNEVISVLQ